MNFESSFPYLLLLTCIVPDDKYVLGDTSLSSVEW